MYMYYYLPERLPGPSPFWPVVAPSPRASTTTTVDSRENCLNTQQINSKLYEGHENKNNFSMGRLNYRYQKRDSTPATAASSAPVILFEKNVLTCVTFLLFIGLAIWLVAVATDFWIVPVVLLSGSLNGGLEIEAQNRTFLWSHSGMWRRCDYYRTASATVSLFLTKECMHFIMYTYYLTNAIYTVFQLDRVYFLKELYYPWNLWILLFAY